MLDKVWDKTALIVSSCNWARNMAYPERKKVEKSKITLDQPIMVPDLVCQFQMICLKEPKLLSRNQKTYMGITD